MSYGSCYASLPVLKVSTEILLRAVGIHKFNHTAESAFLSYHSLMIARCGNLVTPPSRSNLSGKLIGSTSLCLQKTRNIVCERELCLIWISESRLESLLPYHHTIHIDIIHTQTGSHPLCRNHSAGICHIRHKPACTVCSQEITACHFAGNHRGIRSRNPHRRLPCGIIQSSSSFTAVLLTCGKECHRCKKY